MTPSVATADPPRSRPVGPGAPGEPRPSGHRAAAALVAEVVNGVTRLSTLRCDPPLTFRTTPDSVVWVGSAAGPIGGDHLTLEVTVAPGAVLPVTSAGAALVLPGPHGQPSTFRIDVTVGERGGLWWYPEPTIVAAGADHGSDTTIVIGAGVDLVWVEEVVLGRHGEQPGRLRSRLRVQTDAGPLLTSGLDLGRPGWDGPAGVGAARAVAQVVLAGRPARRLSEAGLHTEAGPGSRLAASPLADGAVLVNVAGSSTLAVRQAVASIIARARD